MLVSIVIPCYNSEHTIGKVVELAIEEFEKLKDYECEFVLVNDYSRDGTWNAIHALAEKHPNVKGIYATNSEAMEVALNGIDRAELDTDKLTVMGFDINDAVKVALEAGVVDGVVLQNPFGMGYASVIATARAALGMANEANVNTGYTWLTKDNYKDKEIQKMLY